MTPHLQAHHITTLVWILREQLVGSIAQRSINAFFHIVFDGVVDFTSKLEGNRIIVLTTKEKTSELVAATVRTWS